MTAPFELSDFRRALGTFMTGVTVVTTTDPHTGMPVGFTANSFTSVSLEPPLVLVCLGTKASMLPVFECAQGFAVNVLSAHQREISNRFASSVEDRFQGIDWQLSTINNPLITGVSSWFDCIFERRFIAGDHMVMIGEVKNFSASEVSGLGYVQGSYFNHTVEKTALEAVSSTRRIKAGAVIEHQGKLMLLHRDGVLSLLCSGVHNQSSSAMQELRASLTEMGVDGELGSLYAVQEDKHNRFSSMYFHVNCRHAPEKLVDGVEMIPMQEVCLNKLNPFERSVLGCYIREHACGRFGIYFGSEEVGDDTMQHTDQSTPQAS